MKDSLQKLHDDIEGMLIVPNGSPIEGSLESMCLIEEANDPMLEIRRRLRRIIESAATPTPNGIKRMIREGELHDPCSIQELLEQCGRKLDKACSHEILGEVLFEDNDGDIYVVTVEALVGRANPDYAREVLAEEAEEMANLTKRERYDYLEEVYGETVAVDLCNFFDTDQLNEFVERVKGERENG